MLKVGYLDITPQMSVCLFVSRTLRFPRLYTQNIVVIGMTVITLLETECYKTDRQILMNYIQPTLSTRFPGVYTLNIVEIGVAAIMLLETENYETDRQTVIW